MKETKILDYDDSPNIEKLTDFQLIGILEEKVIYGDRIYEIAKKEVQKRNLSSELLADLKTDYNKEIIGKYSAPTTIYFLLVAVILVLCSQPIIMIIGGLIYFCSIQAIKLRYTFGKKRMELFWNRLNYGLLILIALICCIPFFI